MILDNKNKNQKVYEWIHDYTESGEMDIVTGYFTVGALAYLSKPIIGEIDKVLAKHYGFTEEELDYIINYDIKYRMGKDLLEVTKSQ